MALAESSFLAVPPTRVASFGGGNVEPTVVWLVGDHDASTEISLSGTLARAIALDGSDVIVDLSRVQFMSTSTVGTLVRARRFLEERSRNLELRAPSPSARRVLDLCGVNHALSVVR